MHQTKQKSPYCNKKIKSLISKGAVGTLDGEFFFCGCFNPTHNLGLYTKRLTDGNDLLGHCFIDIKFHAVPHIENFIHFLPSGTRLLLNQLEKRRNGKQLIFYDV